MSDLQFYYELAKNFIWENYGHEVVLDNKGVLKYGRNDNVSTSLVTVANMEQDETYIDTDSIAYISSSNAGDTGTYSLEYHYGYDSDGNKKFAIQTGTLAGQTKTALTTPGRRVSRLLNTSGTPWAGDIYIYQDDTVTNGVPQTASKIHLKAPAGRNQSFKCATTIEFYKYYCITQAHLALTEKAAAWAEGELEIMLAGEVSRPQVPLVASDQNEGYGEYKPFIIARPNSDIRMRALADGANTGVISWFNGFLLRVPALDPNL